MPFIEYPFSAPCNGRATPRSNGPCVSQDLGSLEHYRARPVDSLVSARLGVVRNTSSLEQALMESCHDTSNHLPTALPLLRLVRRDPGGLSHSYVGAQCVHSPDWA